MEKTVTFGCGHTEGVFLLGTPQAGEDTLRLLRRSLCPACQRKSRYAAACQCAEEARLLPLQAGCIQHLALAEIIRASLWRLLVPSHADEPSCQLLTGLFNRQRQASFWLAMRGWSMYRLTVEQIVSLLLRLLQPTEKEGPHD